MSVDPENITPEQLSYRHILIHILIILRGYIIGRNHPSKLLTLLLVVNPNSSSGLTGRGWNELYSEIKKALGVVSSFDQETGRWHVFAHENS